MEYPVDKSGVLPDPHQPDPSYMVSTIEEPSGVAEISEWVGIGMESGEVVSIVEEPSWGYRVA